MTTDETLDMLTYLFQQAGTAHHQAFAHVNGADDDWPTWYAGFLSEHLGQALHTRFEVGQLAEALLSVEAARKAAAAPDWPRYYAHWFLTRYGG
jgi:hypothetical protein